MASAILTAGSNSNLDEAFRGCGKVLHVSPDGVEPSTAAAADVLVVDLRGRTRLPSWIAAWKQTRPATPVILVLSAPDPELMIAAMRARIDECLVEPVTRSEARAAIARVTGDRRSTSGEVFAFVGAKGGVGTTTVAVNVAAALARLSGGGALFVELNTVAGDAALMLGAEPRFSVIDAIENTHRADESFFRGLLAEGPHGLKLLAAPAAPFARGLDVARVAELLDFVRRHYRYTVLDVPRSSTAALTAMKAADHVVLIANQELATLRSAALLASAARDTSDVGSVRLVLNRYDRRSTIETADIERAVGLPVAFRFSSCYRHLVDAANAGELPRPRTEAGAMFERFARDLGRVADAAGDRGGLLSRMSASVTGALHGAFS